MPGNEVEAKRLLAFIERIEAVEQNIADEQEGRRDIYTELAGDGFDKKIVRQIVKLRAQDRQKRVEEREILSLYADAIGLEV